MSYRSAVCLILLVLVGQTALTRGDPPLPSHAAVKEWSIFVYAAGDEQDVREALLATLHSMESIPSLRENRQVNLVVQHDDADEDPNYRYLMQYAPGVPEGGQRLASRPIPEAEIRRIDAGFRYRERNSGDPRTLKEFLSWGVRAYPARHYGLILLGHSWGIAGHMQDFHFDGQTYKRSSIIKNYELRRVLEETLRENRSRIAEGIFDFLFIDSCITGQLEIALEFRNLVSYFVGSSIETPYYSLDYSHAFDRFIQMVNSGSPQPMHAQLETLLRTIIANYVTDHVRGGKGVAGEKQYMPLAVFALRTAKLDGVRRAFTELASALNKTSLPAEFHRGELAELENLIDSDGHADLLQLARVLQELAQNRYLATGQVSWQPLAQRARELQQSLGYGTQEGGAVLTRLNHETARGAWVHIEIDDMEPSPERAACDALRLFVLQNRHLTSGMLPQVRDATGHELPANDYLCESRPSAPKVAAELASGLPQPLVQLFDLQISWPLGIPAHLTQIAATTRQPLRRRLSVWIDRGPQRVFEVSAMLSLPGTSEVEIEYIATSAPVVYLRERHHVMPPLATERLRIASHVTYIDPAPSGLYVAEAHTNATLFKHGLGILLKRTVNADQLPYFQGRAPIESLEKTPYEVPVDRYFGDLERMQALSKPAYRDVDFYCLHRIRDSGWADFLFGANEARRCHP